MLKRHCEYVGCTKAELVGKHDHNANIKNFSVTKYGAYSFDVDLCKKHLNEILEYIRSKTISVVEEEGNVRQTDNKT